MFEYMTVQEASKKWGISERRIQKLCSEERVPDLMKVGRMWLIPRSAEKPVDKRRCVGEEK